MGVVIRAMLRSSQLQRHYTFMLSIDLVLEIKYLDLRPVIFSSALWTGLVLLQFPLFPFVFKLLIIDALIDRIFMKGRREIVFLLCRRDERVHMFCEVSGSLLL